jgi:hypothetical protein
VGEQLSVALSGGLFASNRVGPTGAGIGAPYQLRSALAEIAAHSAGFHHPIDRRPVDLEIAARKPMAIR